jgi:tetratricopeptide (TPR) repeat protein
VSHKAATLAAAALALALGTARAQDMMPLPSPKYGQGYLRTGIGYLRVKRYDQAITYLTAAYASDEKLYAAMLYAGVAEDASGDYEVAVMDFDDFLKAAPDDGVGYNDRCVARAHGNRDLDKALADCNAALVLQNDTPDTRDSRAFVYFRMGDYPRAIADCDAALAGKPKLASSLYIRGLARRRTGDAGGADDIANAALIDPRVAQTYAAYGVKP